VRAVTWNLFHGRSVPPGPNRSLLPEFARVLDSVEWDVALLQEAPPRWRTELGRLLDAEAAMALTSRNFGMPVRAWIADRAPYLIGSNEGGSNQLLVRAPWRIAETRVHTLTREPERRRMLWARLAGPDGAELTVANLHGSVDVVAGAKEEILGAAGCAVEWAGALPLVFGGDLNLRPAKQPDVFAALEEGFDLRPPTGPDAIDHLLARGLDVGESPRLEPARAREVDLGDGRAVELSDHAYVTAAWGMR
jgi:endonuclease/exonuclease/phosphatase family metal-dependent hydrolase